MGDTNNFKQTQRGRKEKWLKELCPCKQTWKWNLDSRRLTGGEGLVMFVRGRRRSVHGQGEPLHSSADRPWWQRSRERAGAGDTLSAHPTGTVNRRSLTSRPESPSTRPVRCLGASQRLWGLGPKLRWGYPSVLLIGISLMTGDGEHLSIYPAIYMSSLEKEGHYLKKKKKASLERMWSKENCCALLMGI